MHGYLEAIMSVKGGRVVKRPRMLKLGFFFSIKKLMLKMCILGRLKETEMAYVYIKEH